MLLDQHDARMKLRFMAAVHASIAGIEDIEMPDLDEEREAWEAWLMSEPPKEQTRSKSESAVYAALFPENPTGASPREMQKRKQIDTLREQGLVTEVSERGRDAG